eukprot:151420_1
MAPRPAIPGIWNGPAFGNSVVIDPTTGKRVPMPGTLTTEQLGHIWNYPVWNRKVAGPQPPRAPATGQQIIGVDVKTLTNYPLLDTQGYTWDPNTQTYVRTPRSGEAPSLPALPPAIDETSTSFPLMRPMYRINPSSNDGIVTLNPAHYPRIFANLPPFDKDNTGLDPNAFPGIHTPSPNDAAANPVFGPGARGHAAVDGGTPQSNLWWIWLAIAAIVTIILGVILGLIAAGYAARRAAAKEQPAAPYSRVEDEDML